MSIDVLRMRWVECSRRSAMAALQVTIGLALLGCASGLHVKQLRQEKPFGDTYARAIDRREVSAPVYNYLVLKGWEARWESDPGGTLLAVVDDVYRNPSREALYAAMELSFLRAREERTAPMEARSLRLAAAFYAYHYLFDTGFGPRPSAYDPRLVIAAETYNRALAAFGATGLAGLARSGTAEFPLPHRRLVLDLAGLTLPFGTSVSEATIQNAYRLTVKGTDLISQSHGMGGPLVATIPPRTAVRAEGDPYVPDRPVAFPMSLVLESTGSLLDAAPEAAAYRARLSLHNAAEHDTILLQQERVPLAADYTAALGETIGRSKGAPFLLAMLRPEVVQRARGFYLLQPYQRGKIPVIFVHGLMSIPRTWVPMFNGLMNDPTIRERYQFWFFLYPTGNPVAYSAHLLRRDLARLLEDLDPQHSDPALDRIVLVGHSMGGLMSHMVMLDSGDDFWSEFSDKSFDSLELSDTDRDLLRDVFFWRPLPSVKRVVFISTPHRGSEMALGGIGRFGRSLIRLPFEVAGPAAELFTRTGNLEGVDQKKLAKAIPNSIDSLSPQNPLFAVMEHKPIVVPHHSIIGDKRAAGRTDGSDGVVPYWSSHLDSAESEVIVKSPHGAHKSGPAVDEVRRILLEHVAEWSAPAAAVEQAEDLVE